MGWRLNRDGTADLIVEGVPDALGDWLAKRAQEEGDIDPGALAIGLLEESMRGRSSNAPALPTPEATAGVIREVVDSIQRTHEVTPFRETPDFAKGDHVTLSPAGRRALGYRGYILGVVATTPRASSQCVRVQPEGHRSASYFSKNFWEKLAR